MDCFDMFHESGERVGSAEFEVLPRPGDRIIPRHPNDPRPTYEVVSWNFVAHDIRVIVTDTLTIPAGAETVAVF
jgi:hypothetical protein